MKKKILVFISTILLIVVMVLIVVMNSMSYKQTTFIVDGENFTAEVMDDGSLVLNVIDEEENSEWGVASHPEMYVSDYNATDNGAEFHIIPLSEGKGEMAIHRTKDDGSVDRYILTLSISRHKKKYLQIDTVSFVPYEFTFRNSLE